MSAPPKATRDAERSNLTRCTPPPGSRSTMCPYSISNVQTIMQGLLQRTVRDVMSGLTRSFSYDGTTYSVPRVDSLSPPLHRSFQSLVSLFVWLVWHNAAAVLFRLMTPQVSARGLLFDDCRPPEHLQTDPAHSRLFGPASDSNF